MSVFKYIKKESPTIEFLKYNIKLCEQKVNQLVKDRVSIDNGLKLNQKEFDYNTKCIEDFEKTLKLLEEKE